MGTQEFHAYTEGNLNWMAAFEVEPATQVTYLNAWKAEKTLAVAEARQRMRGGFVSALEVPPPLPPEDSHGECLRATRLGGEFCVSVVSEPGRSKSSGAAQDFRRRHGAREARAILDVGCSVGGSTHFLRESFPHAAILGLDASPYFLAVAELRER